VTLRIEVRALAASVGGIAEVQALHERAADYVHRIWGLPPDPNSGAEFFERVPPGREREHKHTLGVFDGDAMVGCIDLVRGWPDEATAVIGLLLLEPAARGRGIGRVAYQAIEAQARAWPEIRQLRAVVIESNAAARPFWERLGFRANGQTRPHEAGRVKSTAIVLMKPLQR
jgi:RimJ/RimL family protein N-acetyltransferase